MAFLHEQDASFMRARFEKDLEHDVALEFFAPSAGGIALPGQDWEMAEYTRQILTEVAALSSKIHLQVHSTVAEPEAVQSLGILRTPATAIIGAQDYGIRFYGIPAGYEFATLLEVIVATSRGRTPISEPSRQVLARLQDDIHVQVFVTPTCRHCPHAARLAALFAVESPKVRTDIIEAGEFPTLAEQYKVYAVPKIVINEGTEFVGAYPEPQFVAYLVQAAGGQEPSAAPE